MTHLHFIPLGKRHSGCLHKKVLQRRVHFWIVLFGFRRLEHLKQTPGSLVIVVIQRLLKLLWFRFRKCLEICFKSFPLVSPEEAELRDSE